MHQWQRDVLVKLQEEERLADAEYLKLEALAVEAKEKAEAARDHGVRVRRAVKSFEDYADGTAQPETRW